MGLGLDLVLRGVAVEATVRVHDDVVQDADSQEFTDLAQPFRKFVALRTRRDVSAWVVAAEDDRGGLLENGSAKNRGRTLTPAPASAIA